MEQLTSFYMWGHSITHLGRRREHPYLQCWTRSFKVQSVTLMLHFLFRYIMAIKLCLRIQVTFSLKTVKQVQIEITTKINFFCSQKKGIKTVYLVEMTLFSPDRECVYLFSWFEFQPREWSQSSLLLRGARFVLTIFPFVFYKNAANSRLCVMDRKMTCMDMYGLLNFIVYDVWTLISIMIKAPLIHQYLESKTDWCALLFSGVSSVLPCSEMLRLTGSVIEKKRWNTPHKLVS